VIERWRAQVVPQAGIELVAAREQLDGVPRAQLGLREQLHRGAEGRVVGAGELAPAGVRTRRTGAPRVM
jgi:hypothetical protein